MIFYQILTARLLLLTEMEAVRQKLNTIRNDIDETDEKAKNLEMYVRMEQQRLESCLLERESLERKTQGTLQKIEEAQGKYQENLDRLAELETSVDVNESKRKALEKRELDYDDRLALLEDKLRIAKINFEERRQLLEEAKRRKSVLNADLEKADAKMRDSKEKADYFDSEIEYAGQQLRQMERREMSSTGREMELEDEIRFLADKLRASQERWFIGDDKVKALLRTKDALEGESITLIFFLFLVYLCHCK